MRPVPNGCQCMESAEAELLAIVADKREPKSSCQEDAFMSLASLLYASIALASLTLSVPLFAQAVPPVAEGRFAATPITAAADYKPYEFDLSGLPAYRPEQQPIGVIRISGTPLDSLIGRLAGEFKNVHKRVRFTTQLMNTSQALAGLVEGTADIGVMGHSAWKSSRIAFQETYGYAPLEIRFAKGSYDDPIGSTPGVVFFVHNDNQLRQLTVEQIDGIFGAARTGGWDGTRWSTVPARGSDRDIRTWDQLGLAGEWARKPISIYGTDVTLSNWADLIEKIAFQGGTRWNPALREGPRADIVHGNQDKEIVRAVDNDRYAIGFMFQRAINAYGKNVRVLPIAPRGTTVAVAPSAMSFFDGSYPFHNNVYVYLNRKPGTALPPREREFVRFMLSREGQQIIADDRRFIPLNAEEIRAELRKIDE